MSGRFTIRCDDCLAGEVTAKTRSETVRIARDVGWKLGTYDYCPSCPLDDDDYERVRGGPRPNGTDHPYYNPTSEQRRREIRRADAIEARRRRSFAKASRYIAERWSDD